MPKKVRRIQNHHLVYLNPDHPGVREETELIYQGEHWAITQLERRRYISKGFIKAIKLWLLLNEDKAVELVRPEKPDKTLKIKEGKINEHLESGKRLIKKSQEIIK